MYDIKNNIEIKLKKVENWIENNDYKGYEPFDGLSSFLTHLTFGNLFLDRILMQVNRQSPVNLRPILGIKPLDSTIGRGYMAWGYLIRFKQTGAEIYKNKTRLCLDWLIENKSPQYKEFSWGKHFDFAARGGRYSKFEPITIWTSLICQAFLEGYEVLAEDKYMDVANSVGRWILNLPRKQIDKGVCVSYTGSGDVDNFDIHNHNMYAAAILARTAKYIQNPEYLELAKSIIKYSCSKQLENGAWRYGEHPMYYWIDNFHTGYNLDALKCYMDYSGDNQFEENLERGLKFFKNNFLDENGRPKYYYNRVYPVDSQCAAQTIDTLANFSNGDPDTLNLAIKAANWWIENMQDKKGYFYYRKYPAGIKAKTPMLHWAQATTYKALALLLANLK